MKGKSTFTQKEADVIEQLILQKLQATEDKQKGIREKIRKLGFYASDFSIKEAYDVSDFRNSVHINGSKKSSTITPKKEVVKSVTTKKNTLLPSNTISNFTEKELESLGFAGFKSIANIRKNNYQDLPMEKGVYMILLNDRKSIAFLKEGSGGYFKQKNPNVSIATLKDNWVEKTNVLYIGKAGSESAVQHFCLV